MKVSQLKNMIKEALTEQEQDLSTLPIVSAETLAKILEKGQVIKISAGDSSTTCKTVDDLKRFLYRSLTFRKTPRGYEISTPGTGGQQDYYAKKSSGDYTGD